MNTPEILDKIKKLLRLGQSPNRHEAELAVQRAFEIAARHQIDIESISLEDDVRKIVAENSPCGARLTFARKRILNLVNHFFNVSVVIRPVPLWMRKQGLKKPSITWIGKTVDIQIAQYVYDFLNQAACTALKQFAQENRRKLSRAKQQSFIVGFCYGISSTLQKAQDALPEHGYGLILHERARRDQLESELFDPKNLKPVKSDLERRNPDAITSGFIAGQEIQIRKPLTQSAPLQLGL